MIQVALNENVNCEMEEALREDSADAVSILQVRQKYKDQTIFELYGNAGLPHIALANRLPVSASGLNAIIKRIQDSNPRPIRGVKVGKFKLYSLTATGIEYAEKVIFPQIAGNGKEREKVESLHQMLTCFKDKNENEWEKCLLECLQQEQVDEDNLSDTLGHTFIREYTAFYKSTPEHAGKFLELIISRKQLRNTILEYVEKEQQKRNRTPVEILNSWVQDNPDFAYELLDRSFDAMCADPPAEMLEENDTSEAEMSVMNKISADLLRAMVLGWTKKQLVNSWCREGMEVPCAWYLGEKYRQLQLIINQKREDL